MSTVQFVNTSAPDIIDLRNIKQTYDNGKVTIFDDFNFLIEAPKPDQGQFVVILGASGCGKSTILRYICGLQEPDAGEVLIKGQPVSKSNRVSMVFQQYSSFPWLSVLDNVALGLEYKGVGKSERRDMAREMIKIVGLEGHENKFAKHPILSGGQLQRVAIARSLLANHEILVMDEPFGALDINTRLKMQDLLMEIWGRVNLTVVFITHDIPEAVYLADDIYIMAAKPGRVAHHVKTNLPYPRTKEIKRSAEFINKVHEVEDLMSALS